MIRVSPDAGALAAATADFIRQTAAESIARNGRFTIALAGGSTPEAAYKLLAEPGRRETIDWARWVVFFGDERFVPEDDPRSNYSMAKRSLLGHVDVGTVLPVPTELGSPEAAARAYAGTLAAVLRVPPDGPPPAFDLILLGLGEDGHTASLFPGKPALAESTQWVTWSPPGVLPPPVARVTFTFPTINAAREVVFIVSGAKKAEGVREVIKGQPAVTDVPAAGVRPKLGQLTWLLDESAAHLLSTSKQ